MIQVLECVAGVALVAIMLLDIFLAVVVPRRAPNIGRQLRVSSQVITACWRGWRQIGLRVATVERREALLGTFGSAIVIVLLVVWVSGLMLGYGLILDGLRTELRPEPENFGTSLYFAGVAMLTIGFGDFVATGPWARLVSLVAAATGLGLFALVITLMFTLYGSFQRRERAVVVLEAGAGALGLLADLLHRHARGLGGVGLDQGRVEPREVAAKRVELRGQVDRHLAVHAPFGLDLGDDLRRSQLVLGIAVIEQEADANSLDAGV